MTSTEIAVRHTVTFGGYRNHVVLPIPAPLPRNTMDPRWLACVQHRTACDCREAGLAEDRAELRAELEHLRRLFDEVLDGHATWVHTPDGTQEDQLQCRCTGCEIARRAYLRFAATVVVENGPPRYMPLPHIAYTESDVPF